MQQTLKKTLQINGIGLHSGLPVQLAIHPAPADSGIVFCRTDLPEKPLIPARYDYVVDTRNCTCLGDKKGNIVSTIEHIMAALAVAGIDNAVIDVDGPEVPIMDGSGKIFYDALFAAEKEKQTSPRKYVKVLKTVSFTDEKGNTAELSPAEEGLRVCFEIDFPSKIVGHQCFNDAITPQIFAEKIAPCRTFTEKAAVDYLQSLGLIKGGSLDNAVVLDGEQILNPGGFRVENECVNHKVLDAVGDMFSAGHQIIGQLHASRTGHFHNNQLLRKLFSDSSNYKII